ncbi:MAG TPA: class I SAM-dependent methyltransferase [Acidobacteriaceae bacterium]
MDNTDRFTGRAEIYDRYRQRYPTDTLLQLLQTWCGLRPDWLIADIGAGTGMFSEVFLANTNPVIAIEPNDEMRSACEQLLRTWPRLEVRNGTAEATGLPNSSVSIVAAGRAFHWFDIPLALTEFRRILKPDGWMVLVSLGRDKDETPQFRDFEHLLTHHGIDESYARTCYRVHENLDELFAADHHHARIDGEQQLDWETFLGQANSLSVVPQPGHPRAETFHCLLHDYFNTYASNGILTAPTKCWIDAGRLSTQ